MSAMQSSAPQPQTTLQVLLGRANIVFKCLYYVGGHKKVFDKKPNSIVNT